MGRLSTVYAGRPITTRVPHIMEAFIDLPIVNPPSAPFRVQSFGANAFLHNVDKPFEIHRMIPRMIFADAAATRFSTHDQNELLGCVDISIKEKSRNEAMTAGFVPLLNLVKGTAEQTWEWTDPLVLVRGQGFLVQASMESTVFSFAVGNVSALRLQLAFEGFYLVLPPAFDQR